jgi:flagellar basal body-associated protein FliL
MTRNERAPAEHWLRNPLVSAAVVAGVFSIASSIASVWMSKEPKEKGTMEIVKAAIESPSTPEDIKNKFMELTKAGLLEPHSSGEVKPVETDRQANVFFTPYPNLRIEVLGSETHRKSITENHKSNPVLMTGGTVKFRLKTETGEAEQFGEYVLDVEASILKMSEDILQSVSWNRIGANEVEIEVRAKSFRGRLPNFGIVRVKVWHLGQHKRGVNDQTQKSPPAVHWLRDSLVSVAVVTGVFAIASFIASSWMSKKSKEKGKMEIAKAAIDSSSTPKEGNQLANRKAPG